MTIKALKMTVFSKMTNEQLCDQLDKFALAQQNLASKTSSDTTFWHHVVISDLLTEAKIRLNKGNSSDLSVGNPP